MRRLILMILTAVLANLTGNAREATDRMAKLLPRNEWPQAYRGAKPRDVKPKAPRKPSMRAKGPDRKRTPYRKGKR